MTRGTGIYDNEEGPAESPVTGGEKDEDKDTPDVDKNTEEPTD